MLHARFLLKFVRVGCIAVVSLHTHRSQLPGTPVLSPCVQLICRYTHVWLSSSILMHEEGACKACIILYPDGVVHVLNPDCLEGTGQCTPCLSRLLTCNHWCVLFCLVCFPMKLAAMLSSVPVGPSCMIAACTALNMCPAFGEPGAISLRRQRAVYTVRSYISRLCIVGKNCRVDGEYAQGVLQGATQCATPVAVVWMESMCRVSRKVLCVQYDVLLGMPLPARPCAYAKRRPCMHCLLLLRF